MNIPPIKVVPSSLPKGWVLPAQEPKHQSSQLLMIYLVVSLVAIPLLNWFVISGVTIGQQILAYTLFCICTYPVVAHFSKREPGLPVFPIICLIYAASYALPVYFGEPIINILGRKGYIRVLPEDTNHAITLCIVGVLSMQFGFAFFRYSVLSLLIPHLRLELDFTRAQKGVSLVGLSGTIALWAWLSGRFAAGGGLMPIMIVISQLPTLCAAYLYWAYLRGELKGRWALALWVILLVDIGLGLSMGNVRNAIDPMLTIGAVYWMVRRRINWKYAAVGLALVMTLQSVKGEFRTLVWKKGEAKNSIVDRLMILKTLIGMGAHEMIHDQDESQSTLAASVSRVDLVHLFGYAIHRTPRFVPFQYGNTYSYLLLAWVPRLFWAKKPTAQAANQFFGVAYDLQTPESVGVTSIGLPHLVEAFINFGNAGVFFIMVLLGMLYACIDRMFNHQEAGGGGIAIYSTLLMNFVNIETSTAAAFGALPQTILIFFLVLRVFRTRRKKIR